MFFFTVCLCILSFISIQYAVAILLNQKDKFRGERGVNIVTTVYAVEVNGSPEIVVFLTGSLLYRISGKFIFVGSESPNGEFLDKSPDEQNWFLTFESLFLLEPYLITFQNALRFRD